MLISFLLLNGLFIVIGLASYRRSRSTNTDYYLAGQSVKPWLVGLSAVATNNTGYLFMGLIGYTYATGLSSLWLALGWLMGDFFASTFVHKRLHRATTRTGKYTLAGVIAHWHGSGSAGLQKTLALLSLLFLLSLAAAQLVLGSKALGVLLGWPPGAGACFSAGIVMVYCLVGGARASIWTDAAQALVIIGALALLLIAAILSLGGMDGALLALYFVGQNTAPGFMSWTPQGLLIPGVAGTALFVLGGLAAGLSVVGQPHVLLRFMALDNNTHETTSNTPNNNGQNNKKMNLARAWYYSWFIVFYLMAMAVGLLARVILPESSAFDAELALPNMAVSLLPNVLVGFILAGIFAATMSTADALILSCSAIISGDLLQQNSHILVAKSATVLVTAAALGWALLNPQSAFQLMVMSWSGLAAIFAPLLLLLALRRKLTLGQTAGTVVIGLGIALLWRALGWHQWVYEGLPSIAAAWLFGAIASKPSAVGSGTAP